MPVVPVLILIVAAVAANLVLMAFIVIPPMLGRPSRVAADAESGEIAERRAAEAAVVGGLMGAPGDGGVSTHTYDRIVRIVAWFFLLSTTAIVAATGLWPNNQPAILILLALGGLFVVMVPFFFEQLVDFASILKGVVLIVVLVFAPAGVCELLARPMRALRARRIAALGTAPEAPLGRALPVNR